MNYLASIVIADRPSAAERPSNNPKTLPSITLRTLTRIYRLHIQITDANMDISHNTGYALVI